MKRLTLLFCLLAALPLSAWAQFGWNTEPAGEVREAPRPEALGKTNNTAEVKTIGLRGTLPGLFLYLNRFDTLGTQADSNYFFESNSVKRTQYLSPGAPDLGVFTFDGVSAEGSPYRTTIVSGRADSLVSHYINLDSLYPNAFGAPRKIVPSDSLYLYFAYQAGGQADYPEAGDSLVLYFRDTTSNKTNWIRVWGGSSQLGLNQFMRADSFYQVMVKVGDPRFLHSKFQFKIVNYASLTGVFDIWHIDQILFYTGATVTNPNPQPDVGISSVQAHVFGPYTRVSRHQYSPAMLSGDFVLGLTGNQKTPITINATVNLAAEKAPISQSLGTQSYTLPPRILTTRTFIPTPAALPQFPDTLLFTASIPIAVGNGFAGFNNDSYVHRAYADSILSLDDGEANTGFGLTTTNRQRFGQIMRLPNGSDTLSAVWISFLPRYDVGNNKPFELTIWDLKAYRPDSVLYSSIQNLQYGGSAFSHFHRYELARPIIVPDTFIIGVRQFDAKALNLGVDTDYDYNNGQNIVYDNGAGWTKADFAGTLMIRLELNGQNYQWPTTRQSADNQVPVVLYPNPGRYLRIEAAQPCTYTLTDLSGRRLLTGQAPASQAYLLPGTDALATGTYLVQLHFGTGTQTYRWVKSE